MKQTPVCKTKIVTDKRLYSCIAILVLFLVCGSGSLVVADNNVRIQADPVDGAPPLTVTLSAEVQPSLGEPSRYVWSLGDGERQMEPSFSHTYQKEGTYRVNLLVEFEDGIFAHADAVRITVGKPTATPAKTATPTPIATATPTPVKTATPIATPIATVAPTPIVTVTSTPTPSPSLEVTPTSTAISTVTAFQAPVLVTNNNPAYPLTVSLSLEEGTKPLTVEFTIEEAGVSRTRPVAYSWDFGGNAQGKGEKAQHTYANSGEYFPVVTVKFSNDHIEIFPLPKITVLNEITAVTTQTQAPPEEEIPTLTPTITPTPTPVVTQIVPAPPKVDGYSVTIIADKVRGPTPLQVRFTSEAKGGIPLAWRWNFGDGQRNTVQKPAHNYGTPGTYVVQLSVQFGPTWVDAEPIVITVG